MATKVVEAPPWLVRLMTPLIAKAAIRGLQKEHPEFSADQAVAKMRADLGPNPDEAALRMLEAVRARWPADAPSEAPETAAQPVTWHSPSSLALIAANLLPLWGVLAWGWPVFPLLALFWIENVIAGLSNALRMLLADPGDIALWLAKAFMVPFFCAHYGFFTLIHGKLVFAMFGGREYDRLDPGLLPVHAAAAAIDKYGLWLPIAALAASHLVSLCWDYLLRGGYRRASLGELMGRPYSRIFVLHLTIIFGGWAVMLLGSPIWALALLIALKIGFDLKLHLKHTDKLRIDGGAKLSAPSEGR